MKEQLIFFGDLLYDYEDSKEDMEQLGSWIKENHYHSVLNLEGGLFHDPACEIRKRGRHLYSHVKALDILELLQTSCVCLANNHTMDFGPAGLEKTLSLLDERGLSHTGAGKNLEQAIKPVELSVGGHKITVLNYGWEEEETVPATEHRAGCAPRDKELILGQIKACRKTMQEGDRIVVCIHWGFEYNRLPQPYDIDLGHGMIDAGADLVIGHHPHIIQPKESYKGKTIYYSLGNFYVGSKRVRYKKQFDDAIPNQPDYGMGIIFDPDCCELKEILLKFDRRTQRTDIIAGDHLENPDRRALKICFEDITGVDYLSSSYVKRVSARKKNINPILGVDEKKNGKKLKMLANKRKLRKLVKKILRK